uniref:Uncharacterized protein n=1 Tax=Oryza nivara TaxID=4536 RepID=A0A0E0JAB7_ORYNI
MTPSRCRTTLASTTATRRWPPRCLHGRPRHPRGRATAFTTPRPPRPLSRQPAAAVDTATAAAAVTAAVDNRNHRQPDLTRGVVASSRIASVTTSSCGTSTAASVVRRASVLSTGGSTGSVARQVAADQSLQVAAAQNHRQTSPPSCQDAAARRWGTGSGHHGTGSRRHGTGSGRRRRHALSSCRANVLTVLAASEGERAPPPPSLQPPGFAGGGSGSGEAGEGRRKAGTARLVRRPRRPRDRATGRVVAVAGPSLR